MAESDESYNGWSNYETWCVNLWLSNEQETYSRCVEMAREARSSVENADIDDIEEEARTLLADALKEFLDELNPITSQASVFRDLINTALGKVDWNAIAEGFLEE